jgi:hypothetical protein
MSSKKSCHALSKRCPATKRREERVCVRHGGQVGTWDAYRPPDEVPEDGDRPRANFDQLEVQRHDVQERLPGLEIVIELLALAQRHEDKGFQVLREVDEPSLFPFKRREGTEATVRTRLLLARDLKALVEKKHVFSLNQSLVDQ